MQKQHCPCLSPSWRRCLVTRHRSYQHVSRICRMCSLVLLIQRLARLYHCNPWSDTTQCPSFEAYHQQSAQFFMQRFSGMTAPVAEHLANKVFCILDDPMVDTPRITASEFGAWVKDLPTLLGAPSGSKHQRVVSTSSTQGHPISPAVLQSHRPCSRQTSAAAAHRATLHSRPGSRSVSRAPSRGAAYELEASELSTVYDHEQDDQEEQDGEVEVEVEAEAPADIEEASSRSASTNKRRKRGARRKGSCPVSLQDETLASLADASQSLAREISRASQGSAGQSSGRRPPLPHEPIPMYALPASVLSAPSISTPPAPVVTKKSSKWKLSFGKSSGERLSSTEETALASDVASMTAAATATNVSNLIMSLNAPPQTSMPNLDDSAWGRGRRRKQSQHHAAPDGRARGRSAGQALSGSRVSLERTTQRPVSPASTRSGRPLASSASSMSSSKYNWRSSMSTTSSAGNSTSAFTRFSNSSVHSFSTTATSVSSSSWRSPGKTPPVPALPPGTVMPKNIKCTFSLALLSGLRVLS
jgi:hypothetical protein